MAKRMTIKNILSYGDLDLRNLSKKELDVILSDATYRAEDRRSKAYDAIIKEYGKEVTAPQAYRGNFKFDEPILNEGYNTKNRKIKRIQQLQGLLSASTSTKTGYKKSISRLSSHFKQETGVTLKRIMLNEDLSKRFWRILSAVQEKTRSTEYRYQSQDDLKKGYNKKLIELAVNEIAKYEDWTNEMLRDKDKSFENDLFAQALVQVLENRLKGIYEDDNLKLAKAEKRANQDTKLTRILD